MADTPNDDTFAPPLKVRDTKKCYFYHTMDLPEIGTVLGEWDLRGHEGEHFNNVNLSGKRVLELGPASGFFSFYMESKGAEVVSCDLDHTMEWDIVPVDGLDVKAKLKERSKFIKRLNNSYWLAHNLLKSKNKLLYAPVYDLPDSIGEFHVSTFFSILLHLRDPFQALRTALSRTRETVIVTERLPDNFNPETDQAIMEFLPRVTMPAYHDTWWRFTPNCLGQMLAVLGFTDLSYSIHSQSYRGEKTYRYFTMVGRRI